MTEVRVIKSNWIDSELAEVYLYERNRVSGEFEWVHYLIGPQSCLCDACKLCMVGQHDSLQINNRLKGYMGGL